METISLPQKIDVTPGSNPNESSISIQPCHPGFGITLGNALRRILLSSLTGGAVTAFKIKGVSHEFSSIPNVAEDVVEITLNLKQLRLRVHSDQPVEIELKVKGEKKVTAGDITPNSDVEVINKDLVIATLTDKNAELEMRLVVTRGRGYVPTETREGEPLEVGMIAIDSIYTPVRNVGFRVENVRVGQMTNYENLIMNIETDGGLTASEALAQASQILIDHFTFINANTGGSYEITEGESVGEEMEVRSEPASDAPEAEIQPKAKRAGKAKKEKNAADEDEAES